MLKYIVNQNAHVYIKHLTYYSKGRELVQMNRVVSQNGEIEHGGYSLPKLKFC